MANVKVYDDNNHVEGFMPFSGGSDSSDSQSSEPLFYIFQSGTNQPIKKMVKINATGYVEQSSTMNEFFDAFFANPFISVCLQNTGDTTFYKLVLDSMTYRGAGSDTTYIDGNEGYYHWTGINSAVTAYASLTVDSGEKLLNVVFEH